MACSSSRSQGGQTVDPDRKSDRRNRRARAEPGKQAVIPAPRDQLTCGASRRVVQLEYKSAVIVETAAECGGKADGGDVQAARGEQAGTALEQVQCRIERYICLAGKRTQCCRGGVRIPADREE